MKPKTIIVILAVFLVLETFLLSGIINMYVIEHDSSAVRCETINAQTEIINTFIDLNSHAFGLKMEKSELEECEEPYQNSVRIKLQELKNE